MLDTRKIDTEIDDLEDLVGEYYAEWINGEEDIPEDIDLADLERLYELTVFKDELEPYCDWKHGEILVAEDEREDYAKQFADDLGGIPSQWPMTHIDWEAATEELFDPSAWTYAELDGTNYYVRVM